MSPMGGIASASGVSVEGQCLECSSEIKLIMMVRKQLYSTHPRKLLRGAPDLTTRDRKNGLQLLAR